MKYLSFSCTCSILCHTLGDPCSWHRLASDCSSATTVNVWFAELSHATRQVQALNEPVKVNI